MKQRRNLAVSLALVALTGAGCSGDDDAGSTTATQPAKGVRYAECMRANGVSAFPDPDPSGELTADAVANGTAVDTSSPAFEQAVVACKDLEPPGFTGRKRTVQEQEGALGFAECMRENGVKDFPDPVNGEPLVNTYKIPSSNRPGGMEILNAAMARCRDRSAAAGVGR